MEISSIPQPSSPARDKHKQNLISIHLTNLPYCARFDSTTPANKWFSYVLETNLKTDLKTDLKTNLNNKDDIYLSVLLDKNDLPDRLNFSTWFDNGDALYGYRYEYVFYIPSDINQNSILKPNIFSIYMMSL